MDSDAAAVVRFFFFFSLWKKPKTNKLYTVGQLFWSSVLFALSMAIKSQEQCGSGGCCAWRCGRTRPSAFHVTSDRPFRPRGRTPILGFLFPKTVCSGASHKIVIIVTLHSSLLALCLKTRATQNQTKNNGTFCTLTRYCLQLCKSLM